MHLFSSNKSPARWIRKRKGNRREGTKGLVMQLRVLLWFLLVLKDISSILQIPNSSQSVRHTHFKQTSILSMLTFCSWKNNTQNSVLLRLSQQRTALKNARMSENCKYQPANVTPAVLLLKLGHFNQSILQDTQHSHKNQYEKNC